MKEKKSCFLILQMNPPCPKCESSLITRTNSRTNQKFWGCSDYPRCTFTRPIPDASKLTGKEPQCPYCQVPMLLRSKNGQQFYGCPFWKECGAKTVPVKHN